MHQWPEIFTNGEHESDDFEEQGFSEKGFGSQNCMQEKQNKTEHWFQKNDERSLNK